MHAIDEYVDLLLSPAPAEPDAAPAMTREPPRLMAAPAAHPLPAPAPATAAEPVPPPAPQDAAGQRLRLSRWLRLRCGDQVYAVELLLNAKAERESTVLFNVELAYGGVFRVRNVAENQLAPLLMVECPRLVFPFARQVLANTVQQGGFPPLMMEPVDFQALYIQNLRNLQAQQQKAGGDTAAAPEASKPN